MGASQNRYVRYVYIYSTLELSISVSNMNFAYAFPDDTSVCDRSCRFYHFVRILDDCLVTDDELEDFKQREHFGRYVCGCVISSSMLVFQVPWTRTHLIRTLVLKPASEMWNASDGCLDLFNFAEGLLRQMGEDPETFRGGHSDSCMSQSVFEVRMQGSFSHTKAAQKRRMAQ